MRIELSPLTSNTKDRIACYFFLIFTATMFSIALSISLYRSTNQKDSGGIANMSVSRKQMIEELKSTTEPKLIQEGDIQSDNILRVVSSEGGYRLETDAFPIDGPFEISSDEFNEMANMDEAGEGLEGLMDLSEDQLEMVEAGCEPEIPYFRYQMDVRAEGPVFSEDKDELTAMLIDDVMDLVDCQLWEEMKDSELEDWYTWNTYADN